MENEINTNATHIGRKIERIRRLRGMTQTDLGDLLGITKQAVSKMEQSEKIEDERIKRVADALGVTEEGLKKQITFMRIQMQLLPILAQSRILRILITFQWSKPSNYLRNC